MDQVTTDTQSLRVKFWDLGPTKPVMPVKPPQPKNPDDPIAALEYQDAAAEYVKALQAYRVQAADYEKWVTDCGGPIELERWSSDARDAVKRDPKRYVKTLPKGVKPGHGHEDNLRRKAEEDAEFRRVAATDPVFGTSTGAAA